MAVVMSVATVFAPVRYRAEDCAMSGPTCGRQAGQCDTDRCGRQSHCLDCH